MDLEEKNRSFVPKLPRQGWWLFGFGLFLIGQILGMISMGYAAQSVVATLNSFSLVTNAMFAPCLLGEKVEKVDLISIIVIIIGSAMVVVSSTTQEQDYDIEQLITMYRRPLFLAFISAQLTMLTLLFLQMWRKRNTAKQVVR